MARKSKYSPAERMGCTPEALRKWVRQSQRDAGTKPGPTTEDKARIKELETTVANDALARPLGKGYVPSADGLRMLLAP